MKIQTKLSFIFSIIFGAILLLFILVVYHYYSQKSKDDYFERLHIRAAIKVDLIDGETISPDILHLLYQNTPGEYEPLVTIYDKSGKLIYQDKQDALEQNKHFLQLNQVKKNGFSKLFDEKGRQTYGFKIEGLKGEYIVFATGCDTHGFSRLANLRLILLTAYLITMIFIIITVKLFARQAFLPIAKMIHKVKSSKPADLGLRLDEGNQKDELAMLAITFNRMLDQIEDAFTEQKRLVFNLSHELRTPLAAIITELELCQQKECSTQDYQKVISKTLKDAHRVTKLSNSLLDLARASYDVSAISMQKIRLDELMLEVCTKVQKASPGVSIHLLFDKEPQSEKYISTFGNNYLLEVAFTNLMDNACKYSFDQTCNIHFDYDELYCIVTINNKGLEIPQQEQDAVFFPFYRGSNKQSVEGNGIGLYLTQKIIALHHGQIGLTSLNQITSFKTKLPMFEG